MARSPTRTTKTTGDDLGKSPRERKADERARMRALGFVLRQFWVHPKDWPKVQKYLLSVNKKRFPKP